MLTLSRNSLSSLQCLAAIKFNPEPAVKTKIVDKSSEPVLDVGSGVKITNPDAISMYVSGKQFGCKENDTLRCQIIQWMSFANSELRPFFRICSDPKFRAGAKDVQYLLSVLQGLDNYLTDKTFLVGDRISLADISIAVQLGNVFKR